MATKKASTVASKGGAPKDASLPSGRRHHLPEAGSSKPTNKRNKK